MDDGVKETMDKFKLRNALLGELDDKRLDHDIEYADKSLALRGIQTDRDLEWLATQPSSAVLSEQRQEEHELRKADVKDVIEFRSWIKSDDYWFRCYLAAGVSAGLDVAVAANRANQMLRQRPE